MNIINRKKNKLLVHFRILRDGKYRTHPPHPYRRRRRRYIQMHKFRSPQAIRDGGGRANNTRDGPPLLGALPHPRSPSANTTATIERWVFF